MPNDDEGSREFLTLSTCECRSALKAGVDVKFVTGTKRDPTFGGYLVTTDGQKIPMIFGDNLCVIVVVVVVVGRGRRARSLGRLPTQGF
jgi:hypothetical protein